ncbi:hypothetical protein [Epilithonimonas xixisoli]|uniref:Uncharacterized protein n=1 Tax=Epilithonimonas xixisoli TaxID=1476462 RepID=A0A4R8I9M6_9FLAO|nr:hypothetical protein [Epilithonimonas xixisoli]TDX83951.1 hypothetical protein B0I22_1539 [Epilithonimonas xixisoli]
MNLFSDLQKQTADQLLDMINYGLKEKEKYHSVAVFTEGIYEVYICGRRFEKDKIELQFNILDFEGKIPPGFSANWRNYEHIKRELKL